ncbi:hypothetical protein [Cohnella cholangitidis]|uniref:Uncharacterized protein n=1 Tax=Cohnella cholangitidis TaxID=2598458 RepID=A0A7G5C1H3_9BACL|nr:hypothetical protein [Cohnella cholangitidis]QMV43057.1 hypothetical protein FPL14_19110 [Cohnella cholangitidis]
MRRLRRASVTLLLLIGLTASVAVASADEQAFVATSSGGTELPSCHYVDADDGKPIKIVATSAAASVSAPVEQSSGGESASSVWTAAIVTAGVAFAAGAFGFLIFWFGRFKKG